MNLSGRERAIAKGALFAALAIALCPPWSVTSGHPLRSATAIVFRPIFFPPEGSGIRIDFGVVAVEMAVVGIVAGLLWLSPEWRWNTLRGPAQPQPKPPLYAAKAKPKAETADGSQTAVLVSERTLTNLDALRQLWGFNNTGQVVAVVTDDYLASLPANEREQHRTHRRRG